MQLRHGDNLGKGFCTSTRAYITALVPFVCTCACAKSFPKIVPMVKLDIADPKTIIFWFTLTGPVNALNDERFFCCLSSALTV